MPPLPAHRRSRRAPARIACGVLAASLALTACGKGGSDDSGEEDGELKTGIGVSKDEITLGVFADTSGVYKNLGLGVVQGHQIWETEINDKGGVCDRKIKLEIRDHGYKADTAKVQFPDIEPKVLGFMSLLGSPVNAALKQDMIDKKTTAIALSWSSQILDNPYVIIPGTTYDIEMINGLSYLMEEGKLSDGDTIGHIYIQGEYGENGLRGAEYFAKEHDIKVEKVAVQATDTDMASIVTGFKGKNVKAIALTTTPAQTASAAATNEALKLEVPLVGNNPVFSPQLLDSPAAEALERLSVVASAVPFGSDVPKAKEVAQKYKDRFKEVPNAGVPYGYAIGMIWGQILEEACANEDLTREGITEAFENLDAVTTDDLVADLDFTEQGTPATREVYVAVPDKSVDGGLKQVKALFASDEAKSYVAPHQKGGSGSGATSSPSPSTSASASEEESSSPSPSAASASDADRGTRSAS
jgi:ABC-type branched-subunit amino acid transport system substrate-binding protein